MIAATAFAGNDVIVNPINQPVPVIPSTNPYGWKSDHNSSALEASHVIKGSAGTLGQLSVTDTTAEYILIIDSATLPANGAVTLLYPPIPVGANTVTMINFSIPLQATNGIVVCNSSTGTFTKTIGGSTCIFSSKYQ